VGIHALTIIAATEDDGTECALREAEMMTAAPSGLRVVVGARSSPHFNRLIGKPVDIPVSTVRNAG
jgi:hypothetical protein